MGGAENLMIWLDCDALKIVVKWANLQFAVFLGGESSAKAGGGIIYEFGWD
jgi:hypothetical protein